MYLPISSRLARIRTGLAVALPLDETYTQANTAVADISDTRDAYVISGTFTANEDGPVGQALSFGGTQRLVSPSYDSLLDVQDYSFSCFVKCNTIGVAAKVVMCRIEGSAGTGAGRDWSLTSSGTTGAASFTVVNSGGTSDAFALGAFPSTPTAHWIHMAGAKSGTTSILIQTRITDGAMDQQVKHNRLVMRAQATSKLVIGSLIATGNTQPWIGGLSRIAVWRRALTLEELLAVQKWPMN